MPKAWKWELDTLGHGLKGPQIAFVESGPSASDSGVRVMYPGMAIEELRMGTGVLSLTLRDMKSVFMAKFNH